MLMKMGRTGSPLEPRRRLHAGKSGDPCSQNADIGGHQRAQRAGFLFGAREESHRRRDPRNHPKVSILVQQDQDRQDGRTEVIAEPTAVSRPEAFAGEDYFCQDSTF